MRQAKCVRVRERNILVETRKPLLTGSHSKRATGNGSDSVTSLSEHQWSKAFHVNCQEMESKLANLA